jgi:2-dehydro-3-deoxyphosphogluconate aldolase/(4S)-4-hydroxy-2-oxoglutarate aldolase
VKKKMISHGRTETLTRITQVGLVSIFKPHDIDLARSIIRACYNGWATVAEFTNHGDRAIDIFRH